MSNGEDERVQTPRTLKAFSRALSVELPARLAALRKLGKQTRAISGRRPKRRA